MRETGGTPTDTLPTCPPSTLPAPSHIPRVSVAALPAGPSRTLSSAELRRHPAPRLATVLQNRQSREYIRTWGGRLSAVSVHFYPRPETSTYRIVSSLEHAEHSKIALRGVLHH